MILNGIDCILKYPQVFKHKRLGLITSISGVNNHLKSSIQVLHENYHLTALYSPEHGVRGDIEAGVFVNTYLDPYTQVPVYSLYRKDSKRLTEEMVESIDALVYDIQDVGVRYFTFISTLLYVLEDCARYGKELIVLDRCNPLGDKVEGALLDESYKSFVGIYPLCIRYGLTAGEFAMMANKERKIGCNLTVIPCEKWNRKDMFPETKGIWVMPSPGIPRFETALCYAGTCLFEGTNLSEGRGSSAPFEMIGAPYMNAQELAKGMNEKQLPGVMFSPVYFKPTTSKHTGIQCEGVHVHITDAYAFESVKTGIELLYTVKEYYPEDFEFLPPHNQGGSRFIELLFGGSQITDSIYKKQDILEICQKDSSEFAQYKTSFHLYK